MTVEDRPLQGENVLVVAIDNPHLCLGRRICQMARRLTEWVRADRLMICGNMSSELRMDRPSVDVVPIRHHGPLEDETDFIMSFESFGDVELLKQINALPKVVNVAVDGNKLTVTCDKDLREDISKVIAKAAIIMTGMDIKQDALEEIYLKYFKEEE